MRAFLLYVMDHAESGRTDQLKEQTIGVEALGRRADYDPANDNIVRVRAHELRGRLIKYFASEGINEPVIITIPRGAYAPEFLPRSTLSPDTVGKSEKTPKTPITSGFNNPSRFRWRATLACLLVMAFGYILILLYQSKGRTQAVIARPSGAVRDFWAQFFSAHKGDLNVVYADSSIALWQRLSGRDLNLGDYLSHKYLDNTGDNELLEVVSQRATSPADISASIRLGTVAAELGGRINIQFARNTNAEFLHQGNLVLIGSRRSNPWVEVYEPSLNFQLRLDPNTRSPVFLNRSPRSHESLTYAIPSTQTRLRPSDGGFIQQTEEKEFISYGVVALLKRCGTNQLTVLLEGLNEQATQAAGDLLTDPQLLGQLLARIGHTPGSSVLPFEALFQIMSLPGGYDNMQVVAFRTQSAGYCIDN